MLTLTLNNLKILRFIGPFTIHRSKEAPEKHMTYHQNNFLPVISLSMGSHGFTDLDCCNVLHRDIYYLYIMV